VENSLLMSWGDWKRGGFRCERKCSGRNFLSYYINKLHKLSNVYEQVQESIVLNLKKMTEKFFERFISKSQPILILYGGDTDVKIITYYACKFFHKRQNILRILSERVNLAIFTTCSWSNHVIPSSMSSGSGSPGQNLLPSVRLHRKAGPFYSPPRQWQGFPLRCFPFAARIQGLYVHWGFQSVFQQ